MLGDYSDGLTTPLFPFGHGLSYTEFAYEAVAVEPERPQPHQIVRITVAVSNVGDRAADEVVQLYVRDRVARVARPVQQLAGFARVPLAPEESRQVVFYLDPSQLAYYDADMQLRVDPGEIEVMIGRSSADIRSRSVFTIEGDVRLLRSAEIVPTRVELR